MGEQSKQVMNLKKAFHEDAWYSTLGWERWAKDFRQDLKASPRIKVFVGAVVELEQLGYSMPEMLLNRNLRHNKPQALKGLIANIKKERE